MSNLSEEPLIYVPDINSKGDSIPDELKTIPKGTDKTVDVAAKTGVTAKSHIGPIVSMKKSELPGTILVKMDPLMVVRRSKLRCFGEKILERLEKFLASYFYT